MSDRRSRAVPFYIDAGADRAGDVGQARAIRQRQCDPQIEALIRLVSVKILRLAEVISRTSSLAFKDRFHVKHTELRILVYLAAYEPISLSELSRLIHIDKAWISRSLRDLIRRRFVATAKHPTHSRASRFSLTNAAEALLSDIAPTTMAYQRKLLQGLRRNDVERILDLLLARAEKMLQVAAQQNIAASQHRRRSVIAKSRASRKRSNGHLRLPKP
jgi:DNA-binding MarR family transcriptional regulator